MINFWQIIVFIYLFVHILIMYDMYSSCRYLIYEFLFMCLFIYFIVYWGYSKFVYEFMFLMYLVMDHMHWICYDFEHSSSISVTGRMINLCYITWFDFFFPPADYRTYLFVCSYIREMKIQMEKEDMHMTYDQFVHSSLYYQSKGTRFIYCISIFIFIFYCFPFFLLR